MPPLSNFHIPHVYWRASQSGPWLAQPDTSTNDHSFLALCYTGTGGEDDLILIPPPPAVFTFQTEETSQSISLTINDDIILELEERFSLTLFKNESIPGVNVDPTLGTAEITILDNECESGI